MQIRAGALHGLLQPWLLLLGVGASALITGCVRKSTPSAASSTSAAAPIQTQFPSVAVDPGLPVVTERPWLDPSRQAEERTRLLLAQLTENEKLQLLFGYFGANAEWKGGYKAPLEARFASAGYIPGIPRLGVPAQWQTDAGLGVATQGSATEPRERTALPSGLATAATWNPALAERGGAMIGAEARASGFNVMLAGSVNLLRNAYCGRNFEYAGEDPWLAGVMVGSQIKGIQSNHLISTIKHYAGNDQETDRHEGNTIVSDEAARASDLLAFEFAIEVGNPGAVMCAYNRYNGEHSCESEYLLSDVLRGDWQYPGYVLSDWGAVHSAAKAANAGLEQQTGWPLDDQKFFQGPLKLALAEGEVDPERLDEMVTRILRAMFVHGVFDHPVQEGGAIDLQANGKISQAAAEEGAVLLKNEHGLLPLSPDAQVVAIIGGNAMKGVLSGGGSSQVYPEGGNAVPGLSPSTWPGPVVYYPSSPARELKRALPASRVYYDPGVEVESAVARAKTADVAIVFVTQWATESIDTTIILPKKQDELISAVAAVNPRTVVVLQSGSVNLMPWAGEVQAILHAWYPGTSGGRAIANLLAGKANPSGHLPLTIPRTAAQLAHPGKPQAGDVHYTEGAAVGYKWFDKQGHDPLFAFGHGLSYTSFTHGALSAEMVDGQLKVTFSTTNTGSLAGKDVGQVYLAREGWEAPQRLGGFAKVELAPGESQTSTLRIDPRLLATWSAESRRWEIAAGSLELRLGTSSRQILEKVVVELEASSLPASGPPTAPQEQQSADPTAPPGQADATTADETEAAVPPEAAVPSEAAVD